MGWFRLLLLSLQLGLVLVSISLFQIEETFGLVRLLPLIFGGFVVHAVLPMRWRLPFFLVLSWVAIGVVLGAMHGVLLIVLGLVLIGTCHLPVSLWIRVLLLLGMMGVLALLRAEVLVTSWAPLVLPILGAIFMFRLAVYLYDLRHEKPGTTIWQRLSYFFLLPNVCFPLFPVVDYQSFKRTYYEGEAAEIYQKGLLWIFRGVTHLLFYRVVYYYWVPSPGEVTTLAAVVQSMVTTYLLYLRISGQFHLIVGVVVSVRVQSGRDAPSLLSGVEFYRLLASDQHLLEGLHDEALLLSVVHASASLGGDSCVGVVDGGGVCRDVGVAQLPVVLASGQFSGDVDRRVVLGDFGVVGGDQRGLRGEAGPQAASGSSGVASFACGGACDEGGGDAGVDHGVVEFVECGECGGLLGDGGGGGR